MKSLLFLLGALLFAFAPAHAAGKKYVLFGCLKESTPVTLDDGAEWLMDKGDAFPILMFKEQQTQVILQLAGARFMVPAKSVQILEEKEVTPAMLTTYRKNVDSYLEGQAKKWRQDAKTKPGS